MSDSRWPIWKLSVLLYPFAAAAVAINLFLLFLMLPAIGIDAMSPGDALVYGMILGIPAAWASGRWVRDLMDRSEK